MYKVHTFYQQDYTDIYIFRSKHDQNIDFTIFFSDLGVFQRCCVRVLALLWVQFFLIVFDPVRDAQEDPEPMQTVHVARVRLGHGDQDLFRLGLAQHPRKRLQKHLQVTITKEHSLFFFWETTLLISSLHGTWPKKLLKLCCNSNYNNWVAIRWELYGLSLMVRRLFGHIHH